MDCVVGDDSNVSRGEDSPDQGDQTGPSQKQLQHGGGGRRTPLPPFFFAYYPKYHEKIPENS